MRHKKPKLRLVQNPPVKGKKFSRRISFCKPVPPERQEKKTDALHFRVTPSEKTALKHMATIQTGEGSTPTSFVFGVIGCMHYLQCFRSTRLKEYESELDQCRNDETRASNIRQKISWLKTAKVKIVLQGEHGGGGGDHRELIPDGTAKRERLYKLFGRVHRLFNPYDAGQFWITPQPQLGGLSPDHAFELGLVRKLDSFIKSLERDAAKGY